MFKTTYNMNHLNLLNWVWSQLDHWSTSLFGTTLLLGAVTKLTANEVTLFFTVLVGFSTFVYNTVRTKIAIRKEKDRRKREKLNLPPAKGDDDD